MHLTTPASSTETVAPKGFLQKLKSGKRRDSADKRRESVGTNSGKELLDPLLDDTECLLVIAIKRTRQTGMLQF